MQKPGIMLVAIGYAVLSMILAGQGPFADARLMYGGEPFASLPMNLPRESIRPVTFKSLADDNSVQNPMDPSNSAEPMDLSKTVLPEELSTGYVPDPMNLSNNAKRPTELSPEYVDNPMNLSSGYAASDTPIYVSNQLSKDMVNVRCIKVDGNPQRWLINENLHRDTHKEWKLSSMDGRGNVDVIYWCQFVRLGTHSKSTVGAKVWSTWSDEDFVYMFELLDDGLYLFDIDKEQYVKIKNWSS